MDKYDKKFEEHIAIYNRGQMYMDYYKLVRENEKISVERLKEMLELFTSEEKYEWCVTIKKSIDESLDN